MTEKQPSDSPDYGVRLTGDALAAHQQQHPPTPPSGAGSEYGPQGGGAPSEYGPQPGQGGYQPPSSGQPGFQHPGGPYNQPGAAPYPGGAPAGQPVGTPGLHPDMVQEPQRPKSVVLAFWAIIAAGVSALLAALVSVSLPNRGMSNDELAMMDDMLGPMMADLPFDSVAGYLNSPLMGAAMIVQAAIFLVVYVLVALGIRSGWRSMRIVGTVFAVLSLLNITFMAAPLVAVLTNLSVILGVVGIVYAWLRPSTEYFRQKAWQKAAKRAYPGVASR